MPSTCPAARIRPAIFTSPKASSSIRHCYRRCPSASSTTVWGKSSNTAASATLFELLEKLDDQSVFEHWEEIIERCCQSKADIVEHDVFDMGERMMLNFGHTIGHAIEGCYGFGHYTHGEGVAAGMSMLTGVTEAMGLTKAGTTARLRKVLEQYGLPTDVDASAEELIPYISNDKKMRGNHITLVIIEEIGKARLLPLAAEDLPKYIRKKDAQ